MTTGARPRRQGQLPPGRHGLSREQVRSDQHQRVMRAVIDVTSISGYNAMNVEHIVTTSGVSRRTFYDMFPDKHAAFVACYGEITDELAVSMKRAYTARADPLEGAMASLAALVDFVVADPLRGEILLVEVQAAGAEAVAARSAAMEHLVALVAAAMEEWPTAASESPLTAEIIVGAIHGVLYNHVTRGETDGLAALLDEQIRALVQPLLGPDRPLPPLVAGGRHPAADVG